MRLTYRFYAMTDTYVDRPSGEELSLVQTCRHQHRAWFTTISQSEQEIDQLMDGLRNSSTGQPNLLRTNNLTAYYSDLKRLKYLFHRLRLDRVCQNVACMMAEKQPCCKPRASLYVITHMTENLRSLTNELNQIQAGLSRFSPTQFVVP